MIASEKDERPRDELSDPLSTFPRPRSLEIPPYVRLPPEHVRRA